MSETERDDAGEPLRPHENTELFGHAEAEQALLKAYRGRRFPHAWLIGGPLGVGKATLAFRLARFIFAFPDPGAPQVQSATSLGAAARSSGITARGGAGAAGSPGAGTHRRGYRETAYENPGR